jgi:prophage regulatory protein
MTATPTTVLRLPAVKQRTGLGRSIIYQKIALGEFPEPIRLGARAVGWLEWEVEAWLTSRVRASRPAPYPGNH